MPIIHLNDLDIEKVEVLSLRDLNEGGQEKPGAVAQKREVTDLVVCYAYPSARAQAETYYAALELELPGDGKWFPPSYYASNKWQTMVTNSGHTAKDMGINPNAKALQVHEKLKTTLSNPPAKLTDLMAHIQARIIAACERHQIKFSGNLTMPWRENGKYESFEARIKIVLVNEEELGKGEHAIIPRIEMNDYISKDKAIWVAEELRVKDTENDVLYGAFTDIFAVLSDGFSGATIVRFGQLQPYGASNISCAANLVTIEGSLGKPQPTYTEPPYIRCGSSVGHKRHRMDAELFANGC
jgi:hypothetical protein